MALRPEDSQGGNEEIVELGKSRKLGRGLPRIVLAACLVAAVVLMIVHRPARQAPRPASAAQVVTTVQATDRLQGVPADWELYGLTADDSDLVAVQLASGRITRTTLTPLHNTGPVSLVPGPGDVIIRPLGNYPGYVVPDGRQPRVLTGALASGGWLVPGPDLADDWFVGEYSSSAVLVRPSEAAARTRVALPAGTAPPQSVSSDGRGGLLVSGYSGSQYDIGAAVRRLVSAQLLAVGAENWLSYSCDAASCELAVIDPAGGAPRALPGQLTMPFGLTHGAVAPDGQTAAVIVLGQQVDSTILGTDATLELIDLRSGTTTRLPVPAGPQASAQALTWSPDCRWVFVITDDGNLIAVDVSTGQARSLDPGVGPLGQIAIRPAG